MSYPRYTIRIDDNEKAVSYAIAVDDLEIILDPKRLSGLTRRQRGRNYITLWLESAKRVFEADK